MTSSNKPSKTLSAAAKVPNHTYTKSISEYCQLTKEEELELSKQIQNGGKKRKGESDFGKKV